MAYELKYFVRKELGETPLEALERLREQEKIPKDVPMTYAGRLDPLAEGLLLILVGDECKKKDEYIGLPKTYKAEVLLGVRTDTHDLLGIPSFSNAKDIKEYLSSLRGTFEQRYPSYSSKTVDGVPLHVYAREGKEVEHPTHDVEIFSYTEPVLRKVSKDEILARVSKVIGLVKGDFRQEEILEAWRKLDIPDEMEVVSFELTVSGGFYVRVLADEVGGCLYFLERTAIGGN